LDGSGTQEDPWLIKSLEDFNDFAADANYWDDYTRLETDVNLAGQIYTTAVIAPDVNNVDHWFQGTAFTGVFNGNDHKILNLTIDDGGAGNDSLGLFGKIDDGEVKNLGIEGDSVIGTGSHVGGLVGFIRNGSISNCYCTGDVSGDRVVGGLAGCATGSISNCYSTGDVHGVDDVGGLVGLNDYSISNCYSTGNVTGGHDVGGLVGYTEGNISNCGSNGDVNGVGKVGGLVGLNDSSISNCYSTGDVNGVDYVGGLVGWNYWEVSDCYSMGNVNGVDYVGGLVGINVQDVSNCYSTGKVEGTGGNNIGGLFGANGYMPISWCVTGWMENCYWDTQTSGQPKMCGDEGSCSSIGCNNSYGRTTSQLHQQSTFTDWDFINVWNIGENQTYPYLRKYSPANLNKDHKVDFLDIKILCEQWLQE
jgi:hypothetical protein